MFEIYYVIEIDPTIYLIYFKTLTTIKIKKLQNL